MAVRRCSNSRTHALALSLFLSLSLLLLHTPAPSTAASTGNTRKSYSAGSASASPLTANTVATFSHNGKHYALALSPRTAPRADEVVVTVPVGSGYTAATYECYVPEDTVSTLSSAAVEPNPKDSDVIADVLSKLEGTCLSLEAGWWVYQYCHKAHIRQYHDNNQNFYLGFYDDEANVDWNNRDDDEWTELLVARSKPRTVAKQELVRSLSMFYNMGTTCDDVKGSPDRQTEVRYTCNAMLRESRISGVKEVSTCKYLLTVETPLLCDHPLFTPNAVVEVPCRKATKAASKGS